jgi:hypothetical protein
MSHIKTIIGATLMTIATLSAAILVICFVTGYSLHIAFESYRNHVRYVRTSHHREAFFLIQHQGGVK